MVASLQRGQSYGEKQVFKGELCINRGDRSPRGSDGPGIHSHQTLAGAESCRAVNSVWA